MGAFPGTEAVTGQQRREPTEWDDTARRERQAQLRRLRRKLADTMRKQDNVLRQAVNADPRDPFTHGLRQRYNDLETERQTLLAGLDQQEAQTPTVPAPTSLACSTPCRT